MQFSSNIVAFVLVACAGLAAPPAQAATQNRQIALVGPNFCQLTLPTTSSPIRNRATGVRNEGTTSAYVTCVYPSGEGRTEGGSTNTQAWLYVASLDGVSHDVSCTGVTADAGFNLAYVTKTITAFPTKSGGFETWTPGDFDGTTTIPDYGQFSVTCLLPPQTAITMGFLNSTTDIGT